VPEPVAEHLLAVLREALSNVVRHSRAGRAEVSVEAGERLTPVVTGNGVGVGTAGRRSGLRNIEERARGLGGTAHLDAPDDGGGTRLRWQVPLRSAPPGPAPQELQP
jgi:signal transduction histidine kinase